MHKSLWCSCSSTCQIDFRTVNECCHIIVRRTRLALIRRLGGFCPHFIFRPSICFVSNVASTSPGDALPWRTSTNLINQLQVTPTIFRALITLLLSLLSVYLTASLSATVSCIYAVTLVLVTFIAPGVLVWAQKYKKYALSLIQLVTTCLLIYFIARSEVPGTWLSQRLIKWAHHIPFCIVRP